MAGLRGAIGMSPAAPAWAAGGRPDAGVTSWIGPGSPGPEPLGRPAAGADGRISLAFDGRLSNRDELRAALERSGRPAGDGGDHEIVLALYEQYGHACVHVLRGSFAIAAWDAMRARLWLARDHMGTRSLYYGIAGDRLVFSTDLGALVASPEISREPDPLGILDYLSIGGAIPPRTMFRGIRKLGAGHQLFWQAGRVSIERYWAPVVSEVERSVSRSVIVQEWERLVEATLRDDPGDAVVCLDAGADSRALAAQFASVSGHPSTNFVACADPTGRAALKAARRLADDLGCRHVDWEVTVDQVSRDTVDMARRGGPVPGDLANALECRRFQGMAPSPRVALRGDGASALLAAGECGARGPRAERVPAAHGWLERSFSMDEMTRLWAGSTPAATWGQDAQSAFAEAAAGGGEHRTNQEIAVQLALVLPETRLALQASLAEATGLECRYPFLDQGLVTTMNALAPGAKAVGWMRKGLWQELVARRVPAWARSGASTRSPMPTSAEMLALARPFLERERVRRAGYFDPAAVSALVEDVRRGRTTGGDRLWRILAVQQWHEACVDRRPDP